MARLRAMLVIPGAGERPLPRSCQPPVKDAESLAMLKLTSRPRKPG